MVRTPSGPDPFEYRRKEPFFPSQEIYGCPFISFYFLPFIFFVLLRASFYFFFYFFHLFLFPNVFINCCLPLRRLIIVTPTSATMSIPIHLPGSRLRNNLYGPTNNYLTVFRDTDKEYHIDPYTEPRLRRYTCHQGKGLSGVLRNVVSKPPRRTYWEHEVKIRNGEER